jgi:hypothetical protein
VFVLFCVCFSCAYYVCIFFLNERKFIYEFKTKLYNCCRNLNPGLTTKARACKFSGQEGGREVTSHAFGSVKSVRE